MAEVAAMAVKEIGFRLWVAAMLGVAVTEAASMELEWMDTAARIVVWGLEEEQRRIHVRCPRATSQPLSASSSPRRNSFPNSPSCSSSRGAHRRVHRGGYRGAYKGLHRGVHREGYSGDYSGVHRRLHMGVHMDRRQAVSNSSRRAPYARWC